MNERRKSVSAETVRAPMVTKVLVGPGSDRVKMNVETNSSFVSFKSTTFLSNRSIATILTAAHTRYCCPRLAGCLITDHH